MFLVIFDNSNLDVLINFVLIKKKSVQKSRSKKQVLEAMFKFKNLV